MRILLGARHRRVFWPASEFPSNFCPLLSFSYSKPRSNGSRRSRLCLHLTVRRYNSLVGWLARRCEVAHSDSGLVEGERAAKLSRRVFRVEYRVTGLTGQTARVGNKCCSRHVSSRDLAVGDLLGIECLAVQEQLSIEFAWAPVGSGCNKIDSAFLSLRDCSPIFSR